MPYAVAVASDRLRYAACPDNGSDDDRALAYELACGLIAAARDELARRGSLPVAAPGGGVST